MKQNRILIPLFCAAAAFFTLALVHQLGRETELLQQHIKPGTYLQVSGPSPRNSKLTRVRPLPRPVHSNASRDTNQQSASFEQVALKHGTDKVTTHSYQHMYEKYLLPLRSLPLKMLEIGLGCNMDYGPGASYYTWLEYLPNVELYFIEFDALCANKYQDKTANAHVFVGDQADADFLERFAADTTAHGLFDIVVDDGGHTMEQQMTSLERLWPIVKPGGLYVIEDLQTSYWVDYGGDPSTRDPAKHTTMKYLYGILDELMAKSGSNTISHDLLSVECMAEICTLQKHGE
ncbi:methyltransferase [Hirsutella rhossiliensis]|uniref:Methyltransferase domain-containing protein n=1 Tax=Hirsutella rhossiliensis TaxID=111463 RepID=A0A9P8MM92_9HYPO|nr:methyltransferase domain-containing protein [Hirsutella rhossiliensis]KAH0957923.1 methyltransferase domain-containing protein [Hirsutella rhossiliensis]